MGSRLEIDEYDYSNERLNALYTEHPYHLPAGLIVRPDLAEEDREALELEGESFAGCRGPRSGRKFCHEPESVEEMDRERINAYKRVVERKKPEWVERVRDATRIDNRTRYIVAYSGLPPYPAVAILEILRERDELPDGFA